MWIEGVVDELIQCRNDLATTGSTNSPLRLTAALIDSTAALVAELSLLLPFVDACAKSDYVYFSWPPNAPSRLTLVKYTNVATATHTEYSCSRAWVGVAASVAFVRSFHVTLCLYVRREAQGQPNGIVIERSAKSRAILSRIKETFTTHFQCLQKIVQELRRVSPPPLE